MRLLLDTCCLLWALQEPRRLSYAAREALQNPANPVLVSAVSFWEISLKFQLGKLALNSAAPEDIPDFARSAGWEIVSLQEKTAASFHRLPRYDFHRDPFDRLLLWQAIREGHTLVSRDGAMRIYQAHGLQICW